MKEKIDMLLERLEDYKFGYSTVSNTEFERGYVKGYNRAFDEAIFLVKLYLEAGENNDWNIWRYWKSNEWVFWVCGRGVWIMTNADKYMKDGVKLVDFIKDFKDYSHKENITAYSILASFLTQPVKPTLTEDEKVILRNIDKKYKLILRQHNNIWIIEDNDGEKIYHGYCLNYYESNLFKFIQERRRI